VTFSPLVVHGVINSNNRLYGSNLKSIFCLVDFCGVKATL
jgi:hypothetical protein